MKYKVVCLLLSVMLCGLIGCSDKKKDVDEPAAEVASTEETAVSDNLIHMNGFVMDMNETRRGGSASSNTVGRDNKISSDSISENNPDVTGASFTIGPIYNGDIPGDTYTAWFFEKSSKALVKIEDVHHSSALDVQETTDYNQTSISSDTYAFIKSAYNKCSENGLSENDTRIWGLFLSRLYNNKISAACFDIVQHYSKVTGDDTFDFMVVNAPDNNGSYIMEIDKDRTKYCISQVVIKDGAPVRTIVKDFEDLSSEQYQKLNDVRSVISWSDKRGTSDEDFMLYIIENGLDKAIEHFDALLTD